MKIDLFKQRQDVSRRAGLTRACAVKFDAQKYQPERVFYAGFGALSQASYQRFRERERSRGIFHNKSELQKQPQLALN